MNDEAVYRTAPATPGLLNIWTTMNFGFHHTEIKKKQQLYLYRVSIFNSVKKRRFFAKIDYWVYFSVCPLFAAVQDKR